MTLDSQEAKRLRDSGLTLKQVGIKVGRTKERVRQVLVRDYGTANVENKDLVTTAQLASLANLSDSSIYSLRNKGIITPVGFGRHWWLRETPDIISSYRRCKVCGKPLPRGRKSYCSDACRTEANKYKYWPLERKKAHGRHVKRWQERHPEKYKKAQRQAVRDYQLRHRKNHKG